MKQKIINLLSIPIIIWCIGLALTETNAIILRNKNRWDFIDKITFIQSPMLWYYYLKNSKGVGK